jgi:hypothetical protein
MELRAEETYHEDVGPIGPGGRPIFSYKYYLIAFSFDPAERLVARTYVDTPSEAHFLRLEVVPSRPIVACDFSQPLFVQAIAYLRNSGRTSLTWLSREAEGYVPVPA